MTWLEDIERAIEGLRAPRPRFIVGAPQCKPDQIARYVDEDTDLVLIGTAMKIPLLRAAKPVTLGSDPDCNTLFSLSARAAWGVELEDYCAESHAELIARTIRRAVERN